MLMTRRILCFALSVSAPAAPSALAQSGVLIGVSKPVGYEMVRRGLHGPKVVSPPKDP
jgi:hypothetical protein